jgi:glycosyltransferase involved in cell wall biosynthesis
MTRSSTHLVILPAYNPGPRLREVVAEVLRAWQPVHVVVDGSTDGSEQGLLELAKSEPGLTVEILPRNGGKGAAVLAGARHAQARGFTHALVMDADGQHPAASLAEFMERSRRHPAAMILGQPVFPPNIPAERRHGRKLSIGLVHFELLGRVVADPLFGFRVYPLEPLLRVLGPRRGGRRYDFDTEAVVRLGWAGVPVVNVAAPVRYFSRAEGGISHFHYVRDNVTLVWMHTRLITELLLLRWPALLRHRRAAALAALVLLGLAVAPERGFAAAPGAAEVSAGAPEWQELAAEFARKGDVVADFTELRKFPFKREVVELTGEVRVSAGRGLSLHYQTPTDHTVILDAAGILVRAPSGQSAPPADPRAAAANRALLKLLHFDLAGLAEDFVLTGSRSGLAWELRLEPRSDELRRSIGRITTNGIGATIRQIEIRRSEKQFVFITISPPRPPAPFTADEVKTYFR